MRLTGKTRREIETSLSEKTREQLLDLIHNLVTFERLLTAREIAEASHVDKRTVLADMHAGGFVDPIFGAGFFCRGSKSFRVSATAANAWRESFFVRITGNGSSRTESIPAHKKERAESIAALKKEPPSENGVTGKKAEQKAGPGQLADTERA